STLFPYTTLFRSQGQSEKSLERALRGWDGSFRARIRLQRHAQGPRERLEHSLALVMRVVAAQVVDMQRHLGVVGKTLEEFVHQVHVEVADQRALELDVVLEARPAGEIDHDARQRFVERYVGMPVTQNAFLLADGARHRLAQRDPYVLDRMMRVHLQVALCPNIEIEHRVARDLFEHVIEKRNARRNARPSAAVDIDRKGDLRLG